jgi:hypothetical protein
MPRSGSTTYGKAMGSHRFSKRQISLLGSALFALVLVDTTVGSTPAVASTVCPSLAAVKTAVGGAVTAGDDDCTFNVGQDTLTFTIEPTADVPTAVAARRADAVRRTAPVMKTKVGSYRAFTGTASGVSQIFYDQKGVLVYISHQEITADSAGVLKRVSAALAKVKLPKVITDCKPIVQAISAAVPTAVFDPTSEGACTMKFPDETVLFVGTDPQSTFVESYDTYRLTASHKPVLDLTVGGRKGFVFQAFDTTLVLGLSDALAVVAVNSSIGQTPFAKSLPARAAAALK